MLSRQQLHFKEKKMVTTTAVLGFTDNSGSSFQYPINTIASGILICTGTANDASWDTSLPSVVQSNITALGTVASGTWNATAIGATKGGTGITSYASGDILYASAANTLSRLAKGTDGQILTLASGIPSWANASSASLSFSTPTFSSATSSTQLSATRNAQVLYTFPTSMTSLLTSQALTATLQYADDSGFTTNVITVNTDVQGCSGILSLTLSGRLQVQGIIPAAKYRKVTLSQTGGATVPTTLASGQEVLL